ncbi:MAG: hypothetical protein LKK40_10615 [Bifidobacterium tibiigranuli]|nr:hypothetical protein [Bifidobacterium tibiigranuli]MCI2186727.1 hypothetical protein [Bifidobacterium tibiigranuli]MCI2204998.1 hypothetical protein [Bifidobacterium tibiigranuli]
MGQIQTFDQRNHPWSGLSLALFLRFGRPVQRVALHLRIAQHVEGLLELGPDPPLAVLVDIDAGEERLVAQFAVQVVAPLVDVRDVGQQAERVLQVLACFQVLVVVGGDVVVDRLQGRADAGLLAFEHVQGHGVGVVGLQQLEALAFQLVALPGELFELLGLGGHEPVELGMQHPGHVFTHLRRDLDGLVILLNQAFHILDEDRVTGAVGASGMPSRAHEIGVDAALVVARMAHDEPRAALPAIHRALQIVVMDLAFVGGRDVRVEHGLHLIPDLPRHQRLMGAPVGHVLVGDVALVIRVAQHPAQRRLAQGTRRALRGGPSGEPAAFQFALHLGDRPQAGGEHLECPGDQLAALRVDAHGALLAPVLVAHPDVLVAHRGRADRAALRGLLRQLLDGLAGQVARVELGDGGHDAVQQHARGRLVDVLAGRHQHHARVAQGQVDGHVVGPVARQAVDLVHDAVVDPMLGHVLDHPHERRPVGLASRFAGVHELLDHARAELVGLGQVRVALGGNGVALLAAALLGLFLGRDAQVDHGGRPVGGLGRGNEAIDLDVVVNECVHGFSPQLVVRTTAESLTANAAREKSPKAARTWPRRPSKDAPP